MPNTLDTYRDYLQSGHHLEMMVNARRATAFSELEPNSIPEITKLVSDELTKKEYQSTLYSMDDLRAEDEESQERVWAVKLREIFSIPSIAIFAGSLSPSEQQKWALFFRTLRGQAEGMRNLDHKILGSVILTPDKVAIYDNERQRVVYWSPKVIERMIRK